MINLCSLQQPMWKSIGDENKEGVVSHSSCAHIIILRQITIMPVEMVVVVVVVVVMVVIVVVVVMTVVKTTMTMVTCADIITTSVLYLQRVLLKIIILIFQVSNLNLLTPSPMLNSENEENSKEYRH